jgi:hypothetical protein
VSKLYRSSVPPAGFDLPVRNVRLYGSHDEQVATAALRSRGCPSPDRAYVPARSRQSLAAQRDREAHARRLQRAQVAMLEAQRAVKRARTSGRPAAEVRALAFAAREARAAYLRLTGGVERRTVDAPIAATR